MADDAKSIRDYLRQWLERHKKGNDLVPTVQRMSDEAEWQASAWEIVEVDASPELKIDFNSRVARAGAALRSQLPLPPDYGEFVTTTVTASVTSGTMSAYTAVLRAEDLGCIALERAEPFIIQYQDILTRSNREEDARRLLSATFPALLPRFDAAAAAVQRARSDPGQVVLAAIETRNLVDGLQGELLEMARLAPKENMTWDLMAERLGQLPDQASTSQTLRAQGSDRSQLIDRLSAVAKRRVGALSHDTTAIWPLVVNHVFVVCASIRGSKRSD